jgi:Mor family transcriptional regulator
VKINLDNLVGTQRDIAETIGLDSYIKLCKAFGGDTIYIQKYSELQKLERNAEIRAKYNGYNSSELAREYDLSERYVRIICSNDNLDGQLSIFDNM